MKRLSLTQYSRSDAVHTKIIPGVPILCLCHYTELATIGQVVEIYRVVACLEVQFHGLLYIMLHEPVRCCLLPSEKHTTQEYK